MRQRKGNTVTGESPRCLTNNRIRQQQRQRAVHPNPVSLLPDCPLPLLAKGWSMRATPVLFKRKSLALYFHPFAIPTSWLSNDQTDLESHMWKTTEPLSAWVPEWLQGTEQPNDLSYLPWTLTWDRMKCLSCKAKLLLGLLLYSNLDFYLNIEAQS